jgi:hypothetical protein
MYSTMNLGLGYRPLRVGLLVRQGQIDDLVTAAGLNTMLAGGISNPLIPVSDNDAFAEKLLDAFSIDVLIAATRDSKLEAFAEKFRYLTIPFRSSTQLFMEDWQTNKNVPLCLDSLTIVDHFWQTDFKHKTENFHSKCALVRWQANDELRVLFAITFGFFPSSYNLRDDFEGTFLRGLRAVEVELKAEDPIDPEVSGLVSPVEATKLGLAGYGGSYLMGDLGDGNGIFVGRSDDFDDLVAFWNLRSAGLQIEFLPQDKMARFEPLIRAHLDRVDKYKSRRTHVEPWITVHYRPEFSSDFDEKTRLMVEKHGQVTETIKRFSTTKRLLLYDYNDWTWHERNLRPTAFFFNKTQALATIEERHQRIQVTIGLQEKPFGIGQERRIENQHLCLSVQTFGEFAYEEHTLRLPLIRELNEFYSMQISFDPWKGRVEDDGIGLTMAAKDNHVSLFPIAHEILLRKVLAFAGISAEISQPGLIAKRVVEQLGGLENTWVFKIRGVRDLVHHLKTDEWKTKGNATKAIWADGQFESHEDLFWRINPAKIWDRLLEYGLFRAGLELICGHCRLKNWLSLKDIDDAWSCSYCGHSNQTSLQLKDRGDWKFRKSGLFAKDNNQEGAIPVILTLLQFTKALKFHALIHTPSMNLKTNSTSCETDLCVMQYGSWRGIEIGIGECKSEKGSITQNDVENLEAIRNSLAAKNLKCYLIFSKTADNFSDEELKLFRGLRERQVPLILFSNKELEANEPYSKYTTDKLRSRLVASLEEMARNSAILYLPED